MEGAVKFNKLEEIDEAYTDGMTIQFDPHVTIEPEVKKKNIIGSDTITVNPTKIAVFGVGGGGVNALDSMIRSGIENVELYAANTDVQTLESCLAENVITLGPRSCFGRGVGGDPEKGLEAGRESHEVLKNEICKFDMIFIASGLGGGTGTGVAPLIAQIAVENNVLAVAVVTTPFAYEGRLRAQNAQQGLAQLEQYADALIEIPNDHVFKTEVMTPDKKIEESFDMVNKVLSNSVTAISDIITKPGKINIDFADIKKVLKSAGRVAIGMGMEHDSEKSGHSHRATERALENHLISEKNLDIIYHANNVIVNAVVGREISMQDFSAISDIIATRTKNHDTLNLKCGYRVNTDWTTEALVTIIASANPSESDAIHGLQEHGHSVSHKIDGASKPSFATPAFSFNNDASLGENQDENQEDLQQDAQENAQQNNSEHKKPDQEPMGVSDFNKLISSQHDYEDESFLSNIQVDNFEVPAVKRLSKLMGIGTHENT